MALIVLCSCVVPAFANNQGRNSGKSDGQIILDLKDQVDKEWWNDWGIRLRSFGVGVATGTVLGAVIAAKICNRNR